MALPSPIQAQSKSKECHRPLQTTGLWSLVCWVLNSSSEKGWEPCRSNLEPGRYPDTCHTKVSRWLSQERMRTETDRQTTPVMYSIHLSYAFSAFLSAASTSANSGRITRSFAWLRLGFSMYWYMPAQLIGVEDFRSCLIISEMRSSSAFSHNKENINWHSSRVKLRPL